MHILKIHFNGNPNVGLYGYCNNRYCLLGKEVPDHKAKMVEEVLKVPVHKITICGTSLIGAFVTGNSKTLLVPNNAFEYELRYLDNLGIKYTLIKAELNALGNNILCNDDGCIINPEFTPEQQKKIKQALGVEVKTCLIAEIDIVGSVAALNSRGCIIHRDVTKEEKKLVDSTLGLKSVPGTVNMGSPYIRSGLLCNDNGFVIGELSGGPEIVHIEEELGFLEPVKPVKTVKKKPVKEKVAKEKPVKEKPVKKRATKKKKE